jgi:hypothetical protein
LLVVRPMSQICSISISISCKRSQEIRNEREGEEQDEEVAVRIALSPPKTTTFQLSILISQSLIQSQSFRSIPFALIARSSAFASTHLATHNKESFTLSDRSLELPSQA